LNNNSSFNNLPNPSPANLNNQNSALKYFQDEMWPRQEVAMNNQTSSKKLPSHRASQSSLKMSPSGQRSYASLVAPSTLVAMCLELSITPFSDSLKALPLNSQQQFDFADSEGLVQVLQWRSLGHITAQELTALYTEWLRRRGISRES
jgi:hypothetical protein